MGAALLEIRNLEKRFGGVVATDDVSLAVTHGEIHALIGPNGAGKTTLIAQLSGAMRPDAGRIAFSGVEVTRRSAHERVRLGLARSYQITSIFRRFPVIDNIALAVQARSGTSLSFWRPLAAETLLFDEGRALLAQVGLAGREAIIAANLAHGEQRQLEVGLALATRPKLLLLDEPMAGLGPEESERMITLIQKHRGSVTVFLVEHDMDAVFRLADRISVMVSGRVIATGKPEEIRANAEVRRAYLGEDASAVLPEYEREAHEAPLSRARRGRGSGGEGRMSALLNVERLDAAYGASQVLFGIDLAIRQGEVATLLGRNGMGKTTTVRSILGLTPARGGAISFRSARIEREPSDRIARAGIALVPEGRQIFPNLTVRENLLAFAGNRSGTREPWTLERVFLFFPALADRTDNMGNQLSGGEQQMLAIGRALMTNPHLLILDEATEGLAPLIREEIWKCLSTLKAAGQTILVIDKYVERLIAIADHHTIIERGRVAWRGTSAELAADRSLWHRYLGV